MIYSLHIFYKQQCIFFLNIPSLNETGVYISDLDQNSNLNRSSTTNDLNSQVQKNYSSNPKKNTLPQTHVNTSQKTLGVPNDDNTLNSLTSNVPINSLVSHNLYKEHTEKDEKLLSGFLIGFKTFCQKLVPNESQYSPFNTFTTPQYRLHYHETPTGYKFVFFTSPEVPSLKKELQYISKQLFIENAVMSPNFRLGKSIYNTPFLEKIQEYVKFLESNLLKSITV